MVPQRAAAARLAVLACCVAFAGLVAVPLAGSVGEPAEVVAAGVDPNPTTTTTAAPPPLPAPAPVEVPSTTTPPAPSPSSVPVVAPPPIVVDDPASGVGTVAAPVDDAPVATAEAPVDGGAGGGGSDAVLALPVSLGRSAPPTPSDGGQGSGTVAGRLWVVSIGIDDYPGARHDLEAARADAVTVTDTMLGLGVPADHVHEVLDGAATVESVLAAVDWLVANAGPEDTALFFFAGHVRDLGGGTEVLVTAEGRWIADWFLAERFAGLRADDAWFAIAACFAGGFQELLGPGRILTGAADPGELAYESAAFGRSYMVEYLFQRAIVERQAPEPTVQSAVAWANAQLGAAYPDFTLWHADQSGHVVWLDDQQEAAPPAQPPPPPPSPPAQPAPAPPPRDCLLGLLCR